MSSICFYLMTKKGYVVLDDFIQHFGASEIAYVVAAEDKNVAEDYYAQIKDLCLEHDVAFHARPDTAAYARKNADLKIAIGWRWLIKGSENLVVLHDSLLPRYRGFAPLVAALINGEEQIGVTALWASEEYDRGAVLLQNSVKIEYPIKIDSAISSVSVLYSRVVIALYEQQRRNQLGSGRPQDEGQATYSLWRDDLDYRIDWHTDSDTIKRTVDALGFPYLGAKSRMGDKMVTINEVQVIEDVYVEKRDRAIGKIIFVRAGLPVVVCKEGLILIEKMVDSETGNPLIPIKKMKVRFE